MGGKQRGGGGGGEEGEKNIDRQRQKAVIVRPSILSYLLV